MKKITKNSKFLIAGILIITFSVFLIVAATNMMRLNQTVQTNTSMKDITVKKVKACDILTKEVAQDLVKNINQSNVNSSETKSNDILVSQCTYTQTQMQNKKTTQKLQTVSLLARSALTKQGADSNSAIFGENTPIGSKKIGGYGDAAFWSPATGQLNILKNQNWYILTVGVNEAKNRSLSETQKFANKIKDQL